MHYILVFVVFVAAIVGMSWLGFQGCVRCASVKGADLSEAPCSPVLSNGNDNAHYNNTLWACKDSCRRANKAGSIDLKCTCTCN